MQARSLPTSLCALIQQRALFTTLIVLLCIVALGQVSSEVAASCAVRPRRPKATATESDLAITKHQPRWRCKARTNLDGDAMRTNVWGKCLAGNVPLVLAMGNPPQPNNQLIPHDCRNRVSSMGVVPFWIAPDVVAARLSVNPCYRNTRLVRRWLVQLTKPTTWARHLVSELNTPVRLT